MVDIKYTKGYKYRLEEDAKFVLPSTMRHLQPWSDIYMKMDRSVLTVYAGYAWDGISGPVPDLRCMMRGSLWHDACYQALRRSCLPPVIRKAVDNHFGAILLSDRCPRWVAYSAVKVVQKKGEVYATTPRKIYTA